MRPSGPCRHGDEPGTLRRGGDRRRARRRRARVRHAVARRTPRHVRRGRRRVACFARQLRPDLGTGQGIGHAGVRRLDAGVGAPVAGVRRGAAADHRHRRRACGQPGGPPRVPVARTRWRRAPCTSRACWRSRRSPRCPVEMLDRKAAADASAGPRSAGRGWLAGAISMATAIRCACCRRCMRPSRGRRSSHIANAAVTAVEPNARGFALRTAAGSFECERVVLAAGLGNARLAPMVGIAAPVAPNQGQIVVLERVHRFLDVPLETIRQTDDGTVLLGDSQQVRGLDEAVDPAVLAAIAARAVAVFPQLRGVRVNRTWAALRVMSPDGFPIYAQSSAHPGASVVTLPQRRDAGGGPRARPCARDRCTVNCLVSSRRSRRLGSMFARLPDVRGEPVAIHVDGVAHTARAGDTVAAALLAAGIVACRTTPVGGAPRGPYCLMGVCFECLVTIDGQPNRQGCLVDVSRKACASKRNVAPARCRPTRTRHDDARRRDRGCRTRGPRGGHPVCRAQPEGCAVRRAARAWRPDLPGGHDEPAPATRHPG